ncbi:MAG: primosomal protein N', partial [Oscillospiraceae bacterium]|nr:primosomal protein N' [Oscillospiraceae bacterium]
MGCIITNLVAKIAVEKTAFSFDKLFDYSIPQQMANKISPGVRVTVPFGYGNRKRQGMVFSVCNSADYDKIKPISGVLDETPVLNAEMLKMCEFLKSQTFCTYYDAIKLMLPTGLNFKLTTKYKLTDDYYDKLSSLELSQDEQTVIKFLGSKKSPQSLDDIDSALSITGLEKILTHLCKIFIVETVADAKQKVGDETIKMVRVASEQIDEVKLTSKQKSVVDFLLDAQSASIKEISYFTGATRAVVDALAKKGIVELFDVEVYRPPYKDKDFEKSPIDFTLNDEQTKAFDGISNILDEGKATPALLFGVTGSGKTQVFIKLIEKVISQGKQVILLVPEIALTPQTAFTFYKYFGDNVAVLHSGLSVGERFDEYKRIKRKEASIVVGTRSAIFAPFDNIGLIILDEEQEFSYKSESSPRFHARDVAKFRCVYHNAVVLFASATPLIETYYSAKSGKYKLFEMENRYSGKELPETYIIDMKDEQDAGNKTSFSSVLIDEIKFAISKNQQTILFLNRRGFNTHIKCIDCGEVVLCPSCSISMNYHKANGKLVCHYCGHQADMPKICPKCGGDRIRYSGLGTQRLEEELQLLLPNARILRMDTDTTGSRYSYENYFKQFANGEYDILIGTQMVAKGLNFPNVTLVGIISADSALYASDFRSYERAFSLFTQVVGRSGRGKFEGKAIIQTYTPYNDVLKLSALQDYKEFYLNELTTRKIMLYPPFCDICVIGFVGESEEYTKRATYEFLSIMKSKITTDYPKLPIRVLGP